MSFHIFEEFFKKEILFAAALFSFLIACPFICSADSREIKTIKKLGSGESSIDGIGNWDLNDSSNEIIYYSNNTIFAIDKNGDKDKVHKDPDITDVEGFSDWDGDGDKEIFWSKLDGDSFTVVGGDFINNKVVVARRDLFEYFSPITYTENSDYKGLFIHFKTRSIRSEETVRTGSNLYFIPKDNYCGNRLMTCQNQVYSDSFYAWGGYSSDPKGLAVADLDSDNESELVGISKDQNLVWYDFYNSTPNYLDVNAIELMGETYDVDYDGWQEAAYVTPQHNLSWIDVNKEERVTNIKAEKLGGVGNWDDDGFKEMSFIDPEGNVKILELYQMLGTKEVLTERAGLAQEITVEIMIDNNRRKEAINLSVKDRFPDEFEPMASYGSLEVNITGPNSSETVDAPLIEGDDTWTISLSHLNSSLLSGLEPQENISLSYSIITPNVPGRYRLPQAEIYWEEF